MRNSPLKALIFGALFLQSIPALACTYPNHDGSLNYSKCTEAQKREHAKHNASDTTAEPAVTGHKPGQTHAVADQMSGARTTNTVKDIKVKNDTQQLSATSGKKPMGETAGGGHEMGSHEKISREDALKKIEETFDALAREPAEPGRGGRFRKEILNETREAFRSQVPSLQSKDFSIQEVNAIGDMYKAQMEYSKDLRELRHKSLPPHEYAAEKARIEQAHTTAMEKIHVHAGNTSELISVLHKSINQAVDTVRDRYPRNRDDLPTGKVPGGHGGYMNDRFPKDPTVAEMAAREKLAAGDKAGGLASLNQSIANGGTADAFAMRGALRLENKDYDGAYLDAKKALELNPGDKNALGLLHETQGRTSPGLASSLARGGSGGGSGGAGGAGGSAGYGGGFAAGGFGTRNPRVIAGMTSAATLSSAQKLEEARRAMAVGDVQRAIALAQKALELDPNNASAHNFLSVVYSRMRDYPRAIASASAGLALSPRDASLLNNKAFAENRAKLYRDALASSNGAIEADSRNAYSYANRAHAYGGLGDRDSMLSDINRAAALDARFEKTAADASALQLPSNADMLFLFPGENPEAEAPASAPTRGKSFGAVVAAGILGGLLLALGLLSTVLAPVKDSVVSAFTRATRRGPTLHALETPVATQEPASVAGNMGGLIRGQYEISRQIGQGGMGMVYEGTDRSLGRRVAIKKMRDELRMNPRERDRFVIEAKTVASLHHENIVDIYAIAEEGDDVYLVFEFVDGQTVHDAVQANGRLNISDSLRVTRAMADALAYAHSRGVIHRDVKPSNVMLTSDGRIKVMDFGIARMAKDALTRYSMTNSVVGTPPYMAPEQEQGVVRKESDVYSLAICAYEMLTGKLPFAGIGAGMLMNKINMTYVPPSRAIAGLPERFDEVFLKAFQADPEKRHRTPQEFAAALEVAYGSISPSTKPV